jgi:hypothetical protein
MLVLCREDRAIREETAPKENFDVA